MPVIVRSLINTSQTLDSVALAAWATQTRAQSTAALVAAVAAKTIQMDVISDANAAEAAARTIYQPTVANGDTYQIQDDAETVYFHMAGTIAGATVKLPINPYDGQRIELCFDAVITSLTLNASTATDTSTTVLGALTAATAQGFAAYRYRAVDPNNATLANHGTWHRVG